MPMVVYTDEEVIEKCEQAEAEGARRIAADRDRALDKITKLHAAIGALSDVYWTQGTDLDMRAVSQACLKLFKTAHELKG